MFKSIHKSKFKKIVYCISIFDNFSAFVTQRTFQYKKREKIYLVFLSCHSIVKLQQKLQLFGLNY